jgi:uncharacterized protein YjlB
MIKPEVIHFEGDGITPNNHLPVIIYRDVCPEIRTSYSDHLEQVFKSNNWTNNWRDIVLTQNHYHSTTHEVLGIGKGEVCLFLGGKNGKEILAKAGDVLIIPAGVGHYSLNNSTFYEVVGGYPNGLEWDMIYDEPNKYLSAKSKIAQIDIPDKDPIFGLNGFLTKLWQ